MQLNVKRSAGGGHASHHPVMPPSSAKHRLSTTFHRKFGASSNPLLFLGPARVLRLTFIVLLTASVATVIFFYANTLRAPSSSRQPLDSEEGRADAGEKGGRIIAANSAVELSPSPANGKKQKVGGSERQGAVQEGVQDLVAPHTAYSVQQEEQEHGETVLKAPPIPPPPPPPHHHQLDDVGADTAYFTAYPLPSCGGGGSEQQGHGGHGIVADDGNGNHQNIGGGGGGGFDLEAPPRPDVGSSGALFPLPIVAGGAMPMEGLRRLIAAHASSSSPAARSGSGGSENTVGEGGGGGDSITFALLGGHHNAGGGDGNGRRPILYTMNRTLRMVEGGNGERSLLHPSYGGVGPVDDGHGGGGGDDASGHRGGLAEGQFYIPWCALDQSRRGGGGGGGRAASAGVALLASSSSASSSSSSASHLTAAGVSGQQAAYEEMVSSALACYRKGRKGGVNYYYRMEATEGEGEDEEGGRGGDCVPLPTQITGDTLTTVSSDDHRHLQDNHYHYPTTARGRSVGAPRGKETQSPPPRRPTSSSSSVAYEPPRDLTVVPLLEGVRRMRRSTNVSFSRPSTESVALRTSPSIHSRWLFDDWRLWSGELGCSAPPSGTAGGTTTSTSHSPAGAVLSTRSSPLLEAFVTRGYHRDDLPVDSMYQLDNFCIDEDEGSLVGFELPPLPATAPPSTLPPTPTATAKPWRPRELHIQPPRGFTEYNLQKPFDTPTRFFHAKNTVKVLIHVGGGEGTGNNATNTSSASAAGSTPPIYYNWKSVIKSSLEEDFRRSKGAFASSSSSSSYNAAPSVMFVDEPAYMFPMDGGEDNNPGHIFYRTASASAQIQLLNATSVIFLMDMSSGEGAPTSSTTPAPAIASPFSSSFDFNSQSHAVSWFRRAVHRLDWALSRHHNRKGRAIRSDGEGASAAPLLRPSARHIRHLPTLLALPKYLKSDAEEQKGIAELTGMLMIGVAPSGDGDGQSPPTPHSSPPEVIADIHSQLWGSSSSAVPFNISSSDIRAVLGNRLSTMEVLESFRSASGNAPHHQSELPSTSSSTPPFLLGTDYTTGFELGSASAVNDFPIEMVPSLPRGTGRRIAGYGPQGLAAGEVQGTRRQFSVLSTQYASLLSSGRAGCEAFRCATEDPSTVEGSTSSSPLSSSPSVMCSEAMLALHRRCALPHVAIAVSLPLVTQIDTTAALNRFLDAAAAGGSAVSDPKSAERQRLEQQHKATWDAYVKAKVLPRRYPVGSPFRTYQNGILPFMSNTENYTKSVWHAAVRVVHREAKALRRDVLVQQELLGGGGGRGGGPQLSSNSGGEHHYTPSTILPPINDWSQVPLFEEGRRRHQQQHGKREGALKAINSYFELAEGEELSSSLSTGLPTQDAPREVIDLLVGNDDDSAAPSPFAYLLSWRRRLLTFINYGAALEDGDGGDAVKSADTRYFKGEAKVRAAEKAGDPSVPVARKNRRRLRTHNAINDYFYELFAALLEAGHARESAGLPIVSNEYDDDDYEGGGGGESNHGEEKAHDRGDSVAAPPPRRRRRKLICYNRAHLLHVRHPKTNHLDYHFPGQFVTVTSANCHSKQALGMAYDAMWQRYGMCGTTNIAIGGVGEQQQQNGGGGLKQAAAATKHPQSDTNRDAHPIFTLPTAERARMQALFEASARRVNALLQEADVLLRRTGYVTVPTSSSSSGSSEGYEDAGNPVAPDFFTRRDDSNPLNSQHNNRYPAVRFAPMLLSIVRRIDAAQRKYDDAFMAYFDRKRGGKLNSEASSASAGVAAVPSKGRPIRLYQPHRSGRRRAFANFRSIFSALTAAPIHSGNDVGQHQQRLNAFADYIDFEFSEGSRGDMAGLDDEVTTSGKYPLLENVAASDDGATSATSAGDALPIPHHQRSTTYTKKRATAATRSGRHTFNTPRARQLGAAVLTADLMVGTHGADLHVMAYAKPSAFITEIGIAGRDLGERFNSGFFAPIAFSRTVGYFRVLGHGLLTSPDHEGEADEGAVGGQQALLTLPDVRQMYSLTVCGWLATNAVRLADEANANATKQPSHSSHPSSIVDTGADFSFLVPWWCRGGPAAPLRALLKSIDAEPLLGDGENDGDVYPPPTRPHAPRGKEWGNSAAELADADGSPPPTPSSPLARSLLLERHVMAVESILRPSYYSSRSVGTMYGFVSPYCVPLEPSIVMVAPLPPPRGGTATPSSASLLPTLGPMGLSYETLIRLQNECARNLTAGTHGEALLRAKGDFNAMNLGYYGGHDVAVGQRQWEAQRLRVEGLQTLLEAALMVRPLQAQRLAVAMVEGVSRGAHEYNLPFPNSALRATGGGVGGDAATGDIGSAHHGDDERSHDAVMGLTCGEFALVGGSTADWLFPWGRDEPFMNTAPPLSWRGKPLAEVMFGDDDDNADQSFAAFVASLPIPQRASVIAQRETAQCLGAMLSTLLDPRRGRKGLARGGVEEGSSGGAGVKEAQPACYGTRSSGGGSSPLDRVSTRLIDLFNVIAPIPKDAVLCGDTDAGSSAAASSSHPSSIVIADKALRASAVRWIVGQFMRVAAYPTKSSPMMPAVGSEFSYGSNCSRWMPGAKYGPSGTE